MKPAGLLPGVPMKNWGGEGEGGEVVSLLQRPAIPTPGPSTRNIQARKKSPHPTWL